MKRASSFIQKTCLNSFIIQIWMSRPLGVEQFLFNPYAQVSLSNIQGYFDQYPCITSLFGWWCRLYKHSVEHRLVKWREHIERGRAFLCNLVFVTLPRAFFCRHPCYRGKYSIAVLIALYMHHHGDLGLYKQNLIELIVILALTM